MRRTLVVAGLLASLTAAAGGIRGADLGRGFRPGSMSRLVDPARGGALFEFLPVSGAGAPVASDLCDALSSADKVGNWWCLKGDGSMATGSQVTLSAAASPTQQTRPLCPNGLTCSDASNGLTDGTASYWGSGAVTAPTGDITVCTLSALHSGAIGDGSVLLSLDANTAGNRVFILNDAAQGIVFKSSGASTTATKTIPSMRSRHLICFTYDYVTDGTSVLTPYVDGVAGTASTTAVGPLPTTSSVHYSVAARLKSVGSADNFKGIQHWGSFVSETALSQADMTRLSTAVHGTLTGSRAEALTFTRNSTQFCENGSGAGTTLPANRPCVSRSGYLSEAAGTNLWIRSEEFASWTSVGTPIITSNSTISPDGLLTGDTINDDTAGASEGLYQAPTTTVGQPYTESVWAKAGTQSAMTMYNDDTICVKTLTADWVRYTCTDPAASGAAVGTQINVGDADSDTGTIILLGGQFELGAGASSYIRTEGSTASRVATSLVSAAVTGLSDTAGCMKADATTHIKLAGARIVGFAHAGNPSPLFQQTTSALGIYDGTTVDGVACDFSLGRSVKSKWSGSTMSLSCNGAAWTDFAYDGAWVGTQVLNIGQVNGGSYEWTGLIGNLKVYNSASRCE